MAATITIIGASGSSNVVVVEEGSIRKFELMKEDYIRLVFSSSENIHIGLGDYIVDTTWGTFYITEAQQPTYNVETGGYDYDLQFNAPHYRWNNKLYKFEPSNNRNEASWSLTDKLQNHMAVFLRNLTHHGWTYTVDPASYEYDEADRTVFLEFDGEYLLDALTKIAEAFELEWWITDNIIHLGKAESGTAVDFEVGVNVETMTAESGEKSPLTRIFAFGSTQNIPLDYRNSGEQVLLNGVVQKRLMLPAATPYVDVENGLSEDEIVEGVVMFDDVFPKTATTISEVETISRVVERGSTTEATTEEADAGNDEETETVNIYRFKTSGLTFRQEYILANSTLKVHFTSGLLNGMTFEVVFNPDAEDEEITTTENGEEVTSMNPDAQVFEIVRNDTYGLMLPNDTLKPEASNSFVLTGWDVTKMETGLQLITTAEEELLARVQNYAAKLKIDPLTYPCTMMADYMYGLNDDGAQDASCSKVGTFPLGQRVRLVNSTYFAGGSRTSRVVGFEYKLDIPYDQAVIIVGESATYSRSRATEAAISETKDTINYRNSEYVSTGIGGGNVYVIASNDSTAPSESNVYSALRSDRQYPRKNKNDQVSALWTFKNRSGMRSGLQTNDYSTNGANEDNIFGKGFELISKPDGNGSFKTRLEIDELFVRIKAFFAQLEIREISYVGGNYCFSAAGSKIYYVEWLDASGNVLNKSLASMADVAKFRCYLYSDDGTTATINKWAANDQVMCRVFNIDEGVHAGTTNKYYWRRATGIGQGTIAALVADGVTTEYQYVDISMSDCAAGSDYPEAEDTIVQFGNWTDEARQGVIYLQVEGTNAPAIMEYSGVGADGNHFVIPDPTLMLSPKKNIIYGEFHSVVDEESTGTGSVEDQLQALIEALNDVKNQADQKFEIWFAPYLPLPSLTFTEVTDTEGMNPSTEGWYVCTGLNVYELTSDTTPVAGTTYLIMSENTSENSPASDWTTEALKVLHAQDLFFDTYQEPAADGGRAWRWQAVSIDGTTVYRWMVVSDQDTIDALEKIADVASDGKLTGGAEKTRVYIDWMKAVEEYLKYKEQAEDYGITTERTAYMDAFKALGKLLNAGEDLVLSDTATSVDTPEWLEDLTTTTVITSPVNYRTAWNTYYSTLAALLKAISLKAKDLADDAQADATEALDKIADIASDGKLDPSEKLTIKREFVAAFHEKNDDSGIIDMAQDENGNYIIDYNIWIAPYISAFVAIGTYLNGGTAWTEPTLANFADSTLPAWLQTANMSTTNDINGATFRTLWSTFYSARTAVLTALSENAQSTADNAHVRIDNIEDDGIISGGSEKSTLFIQWLKTVAEYSKYVEQGHDYGVTTELNNYNAAYVALAKMLNDGNTPSSGVLDGATRPSWFTTESIVTDTVLSEVTIDGTALTKDSYRAKWNSYYVTFAALLEAIDLKAKQLADDAQTDATEALDEIDDLSADDVLTPFEKLIVLRDWDAVVNEFSELLSRASVSQASSTSYENAYYQLGNYLYDKNTTTDNRHITYTTMNGSYLKSDGNTAISGSTFKTYWSNYYKQRSDLLAALTATKVTMFASASTSPPAPPYYEGDMWMQTDKNNKMLVCINTRTSGSYTASDWQDLADSTEKRDPRLLLASLADTLYSYCGGYIKALGSNSYLSVYFSESVGALAASEGDMAYAAGSVYQYSSGSWVSLSNSSLLATMKAVYDIVGTYTLRIFRSVPSITANMYDLVCVPITFTDPVLPADNDYKTVEGGIEIWMHNGSDWEILREATKSLIENLSGYVRMVAFGSASGTITSAGIVTSSNLVDMFATAENSDGETIAEAHLSAYVQKDANGNIVSGVSIGADQIVFTGKTFSIDADHINFVGKTVINGKFSVDASGNVTMDGFTATNANITGRFVSANATTMNSIIMDASAGYLEMLGPNGVQDEDHSLPAEGATEIELFKVQFETDPDSLMRVATAYIHGGRQTLRLDAIDGISLTRDDDNDNGLVISDYGIAYTDGLGVSYSKTWSELLS